MHSYNQCSVDLFHEFTCPLPDFMYRRAQTSLPFAMAFGSSNLASKQLPMPWSPHMAMSQVLQFPHPLFVFYSVLIEYAEFILNYFAIDYAKRRGLFRVIIGVCSLTGRSG